VRGFLPHILLLLTTILQQRTMNDGRSTNVLGDHERPWMSALLILACNTPTLAFTVLGVPLPIMRFQSLCAPTGRCILSLLFSLAVLKHSLPLLASPASCTTINTPRRPPSTVPIVPIATRRRRQTRTASGYTTVRITRNGQCVEKCLAYATIGILFYSSSSTCCSRA
jgi:hypothetical protein